MNNLIKQLNEEQQQVVLNGDGHCLVLAGAGSGKTRTLTYRVAYLLENGVKPENILLMTFTNKASKEMLNRVRDILGYEPYSLWSGTFHKIGNTILRKYGYLLGYSPNFAILDEQDSKLLLKQCVKEVNAISKEDDFPKVDIIKSIISYASNTDQQINDWLCLRYNFPSYFLQKLFLIADLYKKRKKTLNVMDFDDLLLQIRILLRDFAQVKSELAEQFKYILVDEYQDTNNIQASIIKDLSNKHKNVLAVGDDSQSIYSFRAADITHILNFEKHFENTKLYKLQTNYRSTPEILELANQSIAYNSKQYFKELKSIRSSGHKPILIKAKNVYDQSEIVINGIKEAIKKGISLNEIAVLFRSGHMSVELQLALSREGIPFVVRSGQRYFDQAHIKDVVAILRIWSNYKDELSWKRVLNLFEGIGSKTADKIYKEIQNTNDFKEALNIKINLTPKQNISFQNIVSMLTNLNDLQTIHNLSFEESIAEANKTQISNGIAYVLRTFYKQYLKLTYDDFNSREEDIIALMNFASNYDNLEKFLTDITLDDDINQKSTNDLQNEKLVLSTIHQAKGLEWKEVYLIGLREGAFPHFKSLESMTELEEERRLFYVATTRAKDKLTLLYPNIVQSYEFGEMLSEPSLFIKELDSDCYVEFQKKSYFENESLFFDENENLNNNPKSVLLKKTNIKNEKKSLLGDFNKFGRYLKNDNWEDNIIVYD